MARPKDEKTGKTVDRPSPRALGTGKAREAAERAAKRRRDQKARLKDIMGASNRGGRRPRND